MAAAALSVRGLATALVLLRGALIRTGIGALIVGAGELVYQFTRLVERVGGVGEAFRLLSDLASEVWGRVGLALDAALARMAAGWEGLKATAADRARWRHHRSGQLRRPLRGDLSGRVRRDEGDLGACSPPPSATSRSRRRTV